jgi:hypothetical protein
MTDGIKYTFVVNIKCELVIDVAQPSERIDDE